MICFVHMTALENTDLYSKRILIICTLRDPWESCNEGRWKNFFGYEYNYIHTKGSMTNCTTSIFFTLIFYIEVKQFIFVDLSDKKILFYQTRSIMEVVNLIIGRKKYKN